MSTVREAEDSPSRSILRGAMALFSAQPLTWGASLLTTAFLPPLLGAIGFGQYSVVMTFTGLVSSFATLGMPNYLPRRVATDPRHADVIGGSALLLVLAVTSVAAASLAFALPIGAFPITDVTLLRLALLGMVGVTIQNVAFAVLNGRGRHGSFAWINASAAASGACLGIGVLLLGGGPAGYMASTIGVSLVVGVLAWRASGIKIRRESIGLAAWRSMVGGGLPFLGWEVARRVRAEIDIIIVGFLVGPQVAGWLAAAYRIIAIPVFIPTLITTPLLPALARSVHDEQLFRVTLRRSILIVLGLTLPMSGMIFAIAPAIPGLLHWGDAFAPAIPVMLILALQQPLVAIDMVLGTALIALKMERRWLRAMIAAAVFNPLLNLAVIPLTDQHLGNGAVGAASVELATEMVMLIGALMLLPRGSIDRRTTGLSVRLVVATAGLVAAAALLHPISVAAAAIGGGAVFVLGVVGLKIVKPSELRSLVAVSQQLLLRRFSKTA